MPLSFLEFEQPIAELEAKIDELRFVTSDAEVNIGEEISRLRAKSRALTTSIFANLTPWQVAQLARHPQRPYTLDYAATIFDEFTELHGDRMYADDQAIVGGLARLEGKSVMLIGHQKGRDTKERVRRNYGMPKPEGYRKALRLMKLAERFRVPLVTLIDTPGAYPGVGSEERNQSEAIARNLFEMATLRVPMVTAVIGEGGSGGALAIGVCDRLIMLQYSVYSVISPEGCASILWKSADKKELAAEAMGITADRLDKLDLVDEVLKEPLGGAHRDPQAMAEALKSRCSSISARSANGPRKTWSRAGTSGCADRACIEPRAERARLGRQTPAMFTVDTFRTALEATLAMAGCDARLARPRLCVALSGGLDSTVLVTALARWQQEATGPWHDGSVRALHVDHGLHPDSASWTTHCARLAGRLGIAFDAVTLRWQPERGASIEAAARTARYDALRARLKAGEILLTAHHADDQLETILLQWLRGGGLRAVAGMERIARFGHEAWLARPLLSSPAPS
jgi:acetyl-CoA carboxylase carboxyl transferase subunit alpha